MPWSLEQCNEAECCAQEGSRLQQRCAQRSMLSSGRQQAAPCASVAPGCVSATLSSEVRMHSSFTAECLCRSPF